MNRLYVSAPERGTDTWVLYTHGFESDLGNASMTLSELHAHVARLKESTGQVPECILLIPGELVFCTTLTLSAKQLREASNGLQYLIEDMVAEDIELLHVIHGERAQNGAVDVLAVSRDLFSSWLEALAAAGLNPAAAVPDFLMVPWATGTLSLFFVGNRVLVRQGFSRGMTTDTGLLPILLEGGILADDTEVRLYCAPDAHIPEDFLRERERHTLTFAEALKSATPLGKLPADFLQGAFKVSRGSSTSSRLIRVAGVTLLAAFSLQLLVEWSHYLFYSRKAAALEAQAIQMYRQLFPEERRIVNLARQLEGHLQPHQRNEAGTGAALVRLAQSLGKQPGVRPSHIGIQGGGELILEVPQQEAELQAIREGLETNGFSVTEVTPFEKGTRVKLREIQ